MFSLRAFTRSIPKGVFRSSIPSIRRPLSTVRKPSLLQTQAPWRQQAIRPAFSAFSTSQAMRDQSGDVDLELSAKINQELQLEQETMSEEKNDLQKVVDDFLESSQYTLVDNPGSEIVHLTRKFGNEDIKITFSISDVNAPQDPESEEADSALLDEEDDIPPPPSASPSKSAKSPEEPPSSEGEEPLEDASATPSETAFPMRLMVTITKPNAGALHIQTLAQDGFIQVEDVHYFKDASLADAKGGEQELKRRDLYAGPPFENLDVDLQMLLERYLEERGIDSALATFVPDLAELKEQREYVGWLGSVKKFVDA